MAGENSDIPPLEDMTEVLKQANAIREQLDSGGADKNSSQKARAKVNKKHPTARSVFSVNSENESPPIKNIDVDSTEVIAKASPAVNSVDSKPKSKGTESSSLFGGMKKGFLFGAPSKIPAKPVLSTTQKRQVTEKDKKAPGEVKNVRKEEEDKIPYISPSGKNESGLTFDEVQQAMSEAKGLMANQDWITDDLLNKIEKNDYLLKRFSDPQFMKALQEFQTSPEAAMAKYKGNQEVEKFLMEFCGLLGDHFTNFGSSDEKTKKVANSQKVTQEVSKGRDKNFPQQSKIVEIFDDENSPGSEKIPAVSSKEACSNDSTSPLEKLTNINKQSKDSRLTPDIITPGRDRTADIEEMKSRRDSDSDVKEMLDDPKVMEILMDPLVMRLIHTLKDDPVKGQRMVSEANQNLRAKIEFLVSRGLLQFQTG